MSDISFEDLRTSPSTEYKPLRYPKSGGEALKIDTGVVPRAPLRDSRYIPSAQLSTASSGKTVFSDSTQEDELFAHPTGKLHGSSNKKHSTEYGNFEDDFSNDFREFQNKKDDFDEAIRERLRRRVHSGPASSTVGQTARLDTRFKEILNLDNDDKSSFRDPVIRHPKSMFNLKTKKSDRHLRALRTDRYKPILAGSQISVPKDSRRLPSKRVIPSISEYVLNEEDEESSSDKDTASTITDTSEEDLMLNSDTVVRSPSHLERFEERGDEIEDQDFQFDVSMIHPQFLPRSSKNFPVKLSSKLYSIQRQDNLLTPRLKRKTNTLPNRHERLVAFKESPCLSSRRNIKRTFGGAESLKPISPTFRIRTIKQQIDSNTPVKRGNMSYNPNSMKWEGNEKILRKFEEADSNVIDPLLIRRNLQRDRLESIKLRSGQKRSEVVGNMVFDEENLRWVSLSGEKPDPFAKIDDTTTLFSSRKSAYPSASQTSPKKNAKIPSDSALPYSRSSHHTFNSYNPRLRKDSSDGDDSNLSSFSGEGNISPIFCINSELLEHFYHEENRWNKKVAGWFLLSGQSEEESSVEFRQASNNMSLVDRNDESYMYEIRNIVLNSTRR